MSHASQKIATPSAGLKNKQQAVPTLIKFAIKQSVTRNNKTVIRILKPRYKTLSGAERMAQNFRWCWYSQRTAGRLKEESRAQVVEIIA